MQVYLVQHGRAKPAEEDPDRHLTGDGVRDVRKVAEFLRPLHLQVEAVWHSGKPRAAETADLLGAVLSPPEQGLRREDLGPDDPIAPVRAAVEEADGNILIVGHLPFLSKLASALVTGDEGTEVVEFRYGGVVCLDRKEAAWKVAWMLVPDLLP